MDDTAWEELGRSPTADAARPASAPEPRRSTDVAQQPCAKGPPAATAAHPPSPKEATHRRPSEASDLSHPASGQQGPASAGAGGGERADRANPLVGVSRQQLVAPRSADTDPGLARTSQADSALAEETSCGRAGAGAGVGSPQGGPALGTDWRLNSETGSAGARPGAQAGERGLATLGKRPRGWEEHSGAGAERELGESEAAAALAQMRARVSWSGAGSGGGGGGGGGGAAEAQRRASWLGSSGSDGGCGHADTAAGGAAAAAAGLPVTGTLRRESSSTPEAAHIAVAAAVAAAAAVPAAAQGLRGPVPVFARRSSEPTSAACAGGDGGLAGSLGGGLAGGLGGGSLGGILGGGGSVAAGAGPGGAAGPGDAWGRGIRSLLPPGVELGPRATQLVAVGRELAARLAAVQEKKVSLTVLEEALCAEIATVRLELLKELRKQRAPPSPLKQPAGGGGGAGAGDGRPSGGPSRTRPGGGVGGGPGVDIGGPGSVGGQPWRRSMCLETGLISGPEVRTAGAASAASAAGAGTSGQPPAVVAAATAAGVRRASEPGPGVHSLQDPWLGGPHSHQHQGPPHRQQHLQLLPPRAQSALLPYESHPPQAPQRPHAAPPHPHLHQHFDEHHQQQRQPPPPSWRQREAPAAAPPSQPRAWEPQLRGPSRLQPPSPLQQRQDDLRQQQDEQWQQQDEQRQQQDDRRQRQDEQRQRQDDPRHQQDERRQRQDEHPQRQPPSLRHAHETNPPHLHSQQPQPHQGPEPSVGELLKRLLAATAAASAPGGTFSAGPSGSGHDRRSSGDGGGAGGGGAGGAGGGGFSRPEAPARSNPGGSPETGIAQPPPGPPTGAVPPSRVRSFQAPVAPPSEQPQLRSNPPS
ncbi:hypothetical protein HYH03_014036 [Edaphochlamys debaryana]|uniref:Uncharacterized protein n=1 Tax=Edaphochlamys debaryana TaxID=47281 RepID=A0A835XPH6_9CHLO|nr:hypothetical protein HYH03_014036 [Edaphochlamys debaryana]|eukprot:KAG2487319.1 hypothetical protein HYH03_014036 [Edaphochlamys debaryana]